MDLQLTGRRALVTGGSRGIGKAVAAALLAEGAEVAIAARDPGRLEEAAADLGAAGRTVYAFVVDTGDDSSVRQLVAAATSRHRSAASTSWSTAPRRPAGQAPPLSLPEITGDAFWSDVNVKVLGYLRCAQAVAPDWSRPAGAGSSASAGWPPSAPVRSSAPSATWPCRR